MSTQDNIKIYDDNALQLAERYDATSTELALAPFVRLVNLYNGRTRHALDIGSGSGRDAFWMASHGWNVDAVDGSAALLEEAKKRHHHEKIRYIHDLAPDFPALRNKGDHYNAITMAAFIFHFEKEQRSLSLQFCADALAPDGLIYLTVRKGMIPPKGNIFDVETSEIEEFASKNDLSFQHHGRLKNSTGMDNISWDHISLWRGQAWNHAKDLTF